ncbi:MAG: PD-(D/E)XK nuclease family transposase [Myxococcota bacterium]
MRFIDPRTDFAFKKIFGSFGHEDVLRSFLNALLYEGRNEIQQLTLQDPYNLPRLKGLKDSYLDVRIKQKDGRWILIVFLFFTKKHFDDISSMSNLIYRFQAQSLDLRYSPLYKQKGDQALNLPFGFYHLRA